MLEVVLGGLRGVMRGVVHVRMGCVRMMCGGFMAAGFVVLGGLAVMMRGMLMMLSGFVMMFGGFFRHGGSPSLARFRAAQRYARGC
jgi:hypothetical protein